MPTFTQRLTARLFGQEISRRTQMAIAALDDARDAVITGQRARERDRFTFDREDVLRDALEAWRTNPLARRIVSLTTQYVIGEGVRIEDRFFLGGDNFRGFRIGAVGPHDAVTLDDLGANTYYVGTVELTFPVGLPKELGVTGRIFSDFGSSFTVDEPGGGISDSGSLRISTGVGFSWHSPFGPIRLDLGYPVRKEKLDRKEVVRVSFGTNF